MTVVFFLESAHPGPRFSIVSKRISEATCPFHSGATSQWKEGIRKPKQVRSHFIELLGAHQPRASPDRSSRGKRATKYGVGWGSVSHGVQTPRRKAERGGIRGFQAYVTGPAYNVFRYILIYIYTYIYIYIYL